MSDSFKKVVEDLLLVILETKVKWWHIRGVQQLQGVLRIKLLPQE